MFRRRKEIAQRVSEHARLVRASHLIHGRRLGEGGLKVYLVVGPDGEGEALNALIELLTIGKDWRVRRCLRGTWLYARYSESTECEECTRTEKRLSRRPGARLAKGEKPTRSISGTGVNGISEEKPKRNGHARTTVIDAYRTGLAIDLYVVRDRGPSIDIAKVMVRAGIPVHSNRKSQRFCNGRVEGFF